MLKINILLLFGNQLVVVSLRLSSAKLVIICRAGGLILNKGYALAAVLWASLRGERPGRAAGSKRTSDWLCRIEGIVSASCRASSRRSDCTNPPVVVSSFTNSQHGAHLATAAVHLRWSRVRGFRLTTKLQQGESCAANQDIAKQSLKVWICTILIFILHPEYLTGCGW